MDILFYLSWAKSQQETMPLHVPPPDGLTKELGLGGTFATFLWFS